MINCIQSPWDIMPYFERREEDRNLLWAGVEIVVDEWFPESKHCQQSWLPALEKRSGKRTCCENIEVRDNCNLTRTPSSMLRWSSSASMCMLICLGHQHWRGGCGVSSGTSISIPVYRRTPAIFAIFGTSTEHVQSTYRARTEHVGKTQ